MSHTSELPAGWTLVPLGELARPIRPRVGPRDTNGLPFIGMEHVEAHTMTLLGSVPASSMKSSAVRFEPGDVMYGRLRPYLNKVLQPDFHGLGSAEFIVLTPTNRIETAYLKYLLNSAAFVRFASRLNTGDRPRVDFDQIATYSVPLPPMDDQRRIIRTIDQALSRLREARDSVRRSLRALDRYSASQLGAVFKGLEDRAGKSVAFAFVTSGSRGWASYYSDSGVPFIRMGNLQRGRLALDLTSVQLVDLPRSTEGKRTRLSEGDLLVSITADLGMVGIVPQDLGEAYVNQHVALARVGSDFDPRYVGWYLISPAGQRELTRFRRGATKAGLGLPDIRSVTAPKLPLGEQAAVFEDIERRGSVQEAMRQELVATTQRAAALREAILRAAFSGRL